MAVGGIIFISDVCTDCGNKDYGKSVAQSGISLPSFSFNCKFYGHFIAYSCYLWMVVCFILMPTTFEIPQNRWVISEKLPFS